VGGLDVVEEVVKVEEFGDVAMRAKGET